MRNPARIHARIHARIRASTLRVCSGGQRRETCKINPCIASARESGATYQADALAVEAIDEEDPWLPHSCQGQADAQAVDAIEEEEGAQVPDPHQEQASAEADAQAIEAI